MSFLNPALLWFAAGGAIPIIIHLLHRQRYRKLRWAAMDFLLRALRKTQRRIRLENLILLLIRILLMILLALAIAKPILQADVAVGDQLTHTIILIDNSFSMAYQPGQKRLFDKARDFAKKGIIDERLRAFSQADRISIIAMSDFPEQVTPGGRNDRRKVKEAIDGMEISDYGTSMLQTARLLARMLDDPKEAPYLKKIYIITDMQQSAWIPRSEEERDELRDLLKKITDHPNTFVYLADVEADDPENQAVVSLKMLDQVPIVGRPIRFVAELYNFSGDHLKDLPVTLLVATGDEELQEKDTEYIVLPANSKATAHFHHTFVEPGPVRVEVRIQTDSLDVDNHRSLALDMRTALNVLCVDGEVGQGDGDHDETYFYSTALDPGKTGQWYSIKQELDTFFNGDDLSNYDLLVLANVPSLHPDVVTRVEEFVARGGGLLITLGNQVDVLSYNTDLWKSGEGLLPARLTSTEGQFNAIGEPMTFYFMQNLESGHPIYRRMPPSSQTAARSIPFNRFFKTDSYDPKAVLANLDNAERSPLLLEKRFGEEQNAGKVILFTSTIDSDWALRLVGVPGVYVPLMHGISTFLAARPAMERNAFVGDTLSLRLTADQYGDFFMSDPDGRETAPARSDLQPGDTTFTIYFPREPIGPADPDDPDDQTPKEKQTVTPHTVNEGLRKAGFYILRRKDRTYSGAEVYNTVATFAVNVPPRTSRIDDIMASESNLERIAYDKDSPAPLREYPDFPARVISEKTPGQEMIVYEAEGSGFWGPLMYALLGLLAFESLLALFFGLHKR